MIADPEHGETSTEVHDPGRGLHRLALAEVGRAIAWLDRTDEDPSLAVHECRKGAKRLRALARLGKHRHRKAYRRADASLRHAGRALARLRDAAVAVTTAESLHPELANDEFRTTLHASAIGRRAAEDSANRARRALRKACRHLARLFPETDLWSHEDLTAGLTQQYARFRRDALAYVASPSVEDAHQCRKSLQRHLNQLRLLPALDFAEDDRRIALLNELSEQLGLHHDLSVLRHLIRKSGRNVHKGTGKALRRVAKHRQRELEADVAMRLPGIVEEEPEQFATNVLAAARTEPEPVALKAQA